MKMIYKISGQAPVWLVFTDQNVKMAERMNWVIDLIFFVIIGSICQIKVIRTEKNASQVIFGTLQTDL